MKLIKIKKTHPRLAVTFVVASLAIAIAVPMLTGRSLVFLTQTIEAPEPPTLAEAGRTVCVLKDLDFESGEWAAYIVTASSDLAGLPDGVPRQSFLKLTDAAILKDMQRDWCFEMTGGDVATVESYIAILQNGKLRWESGIVIEPNYEGLQSSRFGWAVPKSEKLLSEYAKKFRSSILPVHVI